MDTIKEKNQQLLDNQCLINDSEDKLQEAERTLRLEDKLKEAKLLIKKYDLALVSYQR